MARALNLKSQLPEVAINRYHMLCAVLGGTELNDVSLMHS
jgi:hypothetical protein